MSRELPANFRSRFHAILTANQNLPAVAGTRVQLTVAAAPAMPNFTPPLGEWNNVTHLFTPQSPGYYLLTGSTTFLHGFANIVIDVMIGAPGAFQYRRGSVVTVAGSRETAAYSGIFYIDPTLSIELWAFNNDPLNAATIIGEPGGFSTYLDGIRIQ